MIERSCDYYDSFLHFDPFYTHHVVAFGDKKVVQKEINQDENWDISSQNFKV